ncbi:MAG: hypothetical protein LBS70_05560, partial [Candidatus Accumulibacter sp.]|nr:hypothetical protein [Accumulibacter sp.]
MKGRMRLEASENRLPSPDGDVFLLGFRFAATQPTALQATEDRGQSAARSAALYSGNSILTRGVSSDYRLQTTKARLARCSV